MIGADPQPLFAGNLVRQTTVPAPLPYEKHMDRSTGVKVKIAFYMTLLFVLFSLQGTYRVANTLYSSFTSQPLEMLQESGAPTMKGIVIFASIFFAVAFIMLLQS